MSRRAAHLNNESWVVKIINDCLLESGRIMAHWVDMFDFEG